jgi:hypothetical protein
VAVATPHVEEPNWTIVVPWIGQTALETWIALAIATTSNGERSTRGCICSTV